MARIFVAVALPRDVAEALASAVPDDRGLRRVAAPLLHVTLAFVGTLSDERVPAVGRAVAAAAAAAHPFRIPLDEIGTSPPGGAPRMIWAGTSDRAAAARIVELGAGVRAGLTRAGIAFDAKPLRPHVTLARVRDGADRHEVRALASRLWLPADLAFDALAVDVVESFLGPQGPRYVPRASLPLAG